MKKRTKAAIAAAFVFIFAYAGFTFYINRTVTAKVNLRLLTESGEPLIAYDSPPILESSYKPDSSDEVMALGMNPGLGVRELHKRGITGKGVGVAVIDQNLLPRHGQYANNLRLYEMNHANGKTASAHGTAVASLAAGKDAGTAPGADLYFISSMFGHFLLPFFLEDYNYLTACVERVLEINGYLPAGEKIRVVSVTRGFIENERGAKGFKEVVDRAADEGVFVITTSTHMNFNFRLGGVGREKTSDPDDLLSYGPGMFWAGNAETFLKAFDGYLFVPMDCRAFASPTGEKDYAFAESGGLSWAVPWLAGMYALCAEVCPEITPRLFIDAALETGDEVNGLKTVINPVRLAEKLSPE